MNKTELNDALAFVNSPSGELQIIFYANIDGEDVPKKMDIRGTDLPVLRELFANGIQNTIINNDDYTILLLSAADERGKCFYEYDLEIPDELKKLESVIGNDNLDTFNFASNQLSSIVSLLVVIADDDNEITLYKKLSPVEVIGRGGVILKKSNQRLERFNDQLLRITPKFQAIQVSDTLIIIDLNSIEKSFGFHEVITREATVSLNAIRSMSLVSNIESLESLINNVSFARKLTRVARNSPVIRLNIPNADIIAFSKVHPMTKSKMRYSADGLQFTLDTKISKNLLIKLLNDDLLTSELTKLYYDSLAKDGIELEQEDEITETAT
jgi:hypothetical protein